MVSRAFIKKAFSGQNFSRSMETKVVQVGEKDKTICYKGVRRANNETKTRDEREQEGNSTEVVFCIERPSATRCISLYRAM